VTIVTSETEVVHSVGTTHSRSQRWMLRAIAWYQDQRSGALSPCRFFPSCSAYAAEAIDEFGSVRGGILAVRRLIRCRPFGPFGYDPVPERHVACNHAHVAVNHEGEQHV